MKNKRIIKKNHEFQEIIKTNKTYKNAIFVIYYKKNANQFFRYGISVGKKIGNAVLRNRIKRQVRSIIQEIIKKDFESSFDIIIIVRNNFIKQKKEDALKKLVNLFELIKKGE